MSRQGLHAGRSHDSGAQSSHSSSFGKRQWKRVLYENQNFPDNYIDSQRIFEQLDYSVGGVDVFSYLSVVRSTSTVAQQISVVAVFLAIYKYIRMNDSYTTLSRLAGFDCFLLVIGHIFHRALDSPVTLQPSIGELLRGVFLFGVCVRVAAPALQTLTSSFSSDTIHALAITFSAVHLVSYDYGYIHEKEVETYSGTISLNAAMITAVLLASRLHDVETVFSFMLLAVICFSFYPTVARLMYQRSFALHLAVTLLQCLLASSILLSLDLVLFIIFLSIILFIWVICPLWLQQMQVYKRSLKGPWDIASL
jgi:phosphatidylinositol N-acetylglucosaminyltransferase subunit C